MATYEEIASLASDINSKINTELDPDSLAFLIETYIVDDEVDLSEVSIEEITETFLGLLLLSDAFLCAQDGESIEVIEAEQAATAEALGIEL
jgi:hypothetical protein